MNVWPSAHPSSATISSFDAGGRADYTGRNREMDMTSFIRSLAALALLVAVAGCANAGGSVNGGGNERGGGGGARIGSFLKF